MTVRINLSDDGFQWVEVKDVADLTAGDRRAMKAAVEGHVNPETRQIFYPGDSEELTQNALAARIITGWSLQWPMPKGDPSVLDKLSMSQIDRLYEGIQPHVEAINDSLKESPADKGTDPTDDSSS